MKDLKLADAGKTNERNTGNGRKWGLAPATAKKLLVILCGRLGRLSAVSSLHSCHKPARMSDQVVQSSGIVIARTCNCLAFWSKCSTNQYQRISKMSSSHPVPSPWTS